MYIRPPAWGSRRRRSRFVDYVFLVWLCLSLAAADRLGAAGSCLTAPWLQASSSKAWGTIYYHVSNRNAGLLLQHWPRHYWRSLVSAGKHEEKDFFGDYSPHPNVDVTFGAPPPPVIGKRRKLLQDYVPVPNTSDSPPIGE